MRTLATALILASVLTVRDVAAQTLIDIGVTTSCAECPGSLATLDLDSGALVGVRPLPWQAASRGVYRTPDGSALVWIETITSPPGGGVVTGNRLWLEDVTGTRTSVPLPTSATWLAGNPVRPEIFLADGTSALALTAAGARSLHTPGCGSFSFQPVQVSADGALVAFACGPGANGYPDAVVFDTTTGTKLVQVPGGPAFAQFSADGTSFLLIVRRPGDTAAVVRHDARTGAVLAELAVADAPQSLTITVDPRTGAVVLRDFSRTRWLAPDTLQVLHDVPEDLGSIWVFDPDRPRAFVFKATVGGGQTTRLQLRTVDTATLAVLESRDLPTSVILWPGRLLPRPTPPTLSATVSGSGVTLTWTRGPTRAQTTRYVLEVGTAPGLSNVLTLDVGLQTSLTAQGVPPGRYYVRVKAGNAAALSLASNEVVVDIP